MRHQFVGQLRLERAIRQTLQCQGGEEFQTTVQRILKQRLPGFTPIVPHGPDGDGGNDGYSRQRGVYAQIYAPSAGRMPGREAARKALNDFAKIWRTWRQIRPVTEYWFVANSLGSNIHVESARSRIEKRYKVKTQFLGLDELTREVAKLPADQIEALLELQVRHATERTGRQSSTLDLIASVSPVHLQGAHLLASIIHPVPRKLCEELLPDATDWQSFWPWVLDQGWATETDGLVRLSKSVTEQCRRNTKEQRKACELWVKALVGYGSIDCLYLAVLPLVTLERMKEAVHLVIRAGLEFADTGWDSAFLGLADLVGNNPKLMRRLTPANRQGLGLARANLLQRAGRAREALPVYDAYLRATLPLPEGVSRGQLMLNCGVAAYRSGEVSRARLLYEEATAWSRRHHDYWTLGRAATNLAQMVLDESGHGRATLLLREAEAAKHRCGDIVGLIGTEMAKGLLAAGTGHPTDAYNHFRNAEQLAKVTDECHALVDIYFNLGTSSGELSRSRRAASYYRRSVSEASLRHDVYREARARASLAGVLFKLGERAECRKHCEKLAELPTDEALADFRLAGLHGRMAVALQSNRRGLLARLAADALAFARKSNQPRWVARILTDSILGDSSRPPAADLQRLLDAGRAEERAGRSAAAVAVYSRVWQSCAVGDHSPKLRDCAESLLDQALDSSPDAVVAAEHLKQKYGVYMRLNQPCRAIEALAACAARALSASLWREYVGAIDQQAVTLQHVDRPDAAEPLHREALRVASRYQLCDAQRISASNLSECLRRLGRPASAYRISCKALRLYDCREDPAGYVSTLHNHYLIERALGRASASRTLRRCESLATKYGLVREMARAFLARGNEALNRGRSAQAAAAFRRAEGVAEHAGLDDVVTDCRYNLAIALRRAGRPAEALRVMRSLRELQRGDVYSIHRATLMALVLEDTGDLEKARQAWRKAADVACLLEDAGQRTYCRTRAELLRLSPVGDARSRAELADRAHALLLAIYESPATDRHVQRRFDAANAFFELNSLTLYRIHAYCALAEGLTARGRAGDVVLAAQASIWSVVVAAGEGDCLDPAAEAHVRWLAGLSLSEPRLRRLRQQMRRWLLTQLRIPGSEKLGDTLLAGFDKLLALRARQRDVPSTCGTTDPPKATASST